MLRDKTFSKRGYSWSGKLLSSVLLTITHTYPLENRFVNPDEWNSEGEYFLIFRVHAVSGKYDDKSFDVIAAHRPT